MSYSVYAYPWNLSLESYRHKLDDMLSLGLQGISLAVSYHAGKFIHPHSTRHRVYFPEDGVVYFRPRATYRRIKPVTSGLLEQGDLLECLGGTEGLLLNAWTVLLHNTRLGMQYPEVTVKNAFGNGYVYNLCPAHPDVREYAVTLCKDLAQHYPINNMLLETPGYLAYSHGYHHEFAQAPPDARLEAWLGLCFCDHCLAGAGKAGIDGAGLRRLAATAVDKYLGAAELTLDNSALVWLENDVKANAELDAFLRWRCEVVTSLVREIRSQVRHEVKVQVITTTQPSHRTSVLEGHDLPGLRNAADGLELPLYQPSAAATKAEAEYVIQKVGGVERLSAILRPGWPDMHSEKQVVETLDCVQKSGFQDISFYNYDMLRQVNLQWLENAIKHKRGTG